MGYLVMGVLLSHSSPLVRLSYEGRDRTSVVRFQRPGRMPATYLVIKGKGHNLYLEQPLLKVAWLGEKESNPQRPWFKATVGCQYPSPNGAP